MKAVSATTVARGNNSHQWWRTEAAISSASISTSTCAGDLELGAVYGQVVGPQKGLEMVTPVSALVASPTLTIPQPPEPRTDLRSSRDRGRSFPKCGGR